MYPDPYRCDFVPEASINLSLSPYFKRVYSYFAQTFGRLQKICTSAPQALHEARLRCGPRPIWENRCFPPVYRPCGHNGNLFDHSQIRYFFELLTVLINKRVLRLVRGQKSSRTTNTTQTAAVHTVRVWYVLLSICLLFSELLSRSCVTYFMSSRSTTIRLRYTNIGIFIGFIFRVKTVFWNF